jgi:hypothetical protein
MEQYWAQLDKERDRILSRGTDHKIDKDRKKKSVRNVVETVTVKAAKIPMIVAAAITADVVTRNARKTRRFKKRRTTTTSMIAEAMAVVALMKGMTKNKSIARRKRRSTRRKRTVVMTRMKVRYIDYPTFSLTIRIVVKFEGIQG